jgi:hypothetical protein
VATTSPFQDGDYFAWLCDRVAIPRDAGSYETTLTIMFSHEFVWIIGNDENRIADGRDIRLEYNMDNGFVHDIHTAPVNFLEVLIGLSERVAFLVDQEPVDWAWNLMKNLKLGGFHDPLSGKEIRKVMNILESVIWRRYGPDGSGGFFPLRDPKNDQRVVEIWDQMSAYIEENKVSFGL